MQQLLLETDYEQRPVYSQPSVTQVSGSSVRMQPASTPGQVHSWTPVANQRSAPRIESFSGLNANGSAPSSVSFPARPPASSQDTSEPVWGGWAPVVKTLPARVVSPTRRSARTSVTSQQQSSIRASALSPHTLGNEGDDFGPSVSRAAAKSTLRSNRRIAEPTQEDKSSLAAFMPPSQSSGVRSRSLGPAVAKAGRASADDAPPLQMWLAQGQQSELRRPGSPAPPNPPRLGLGLAQPPFSPNTVSRALSDQPVPGGPQVASSMGRRGRSDHSRLSPNDELPTLKQLVQVGTASASSSTAAATAPSQAPTQPRFPSHQSAGQGQRSVPVGGKENGTLCVALDVDEVLVQYVDGFRKFLQRERPNGPMDTDSVFHEAHNPNSHWRLQFALSGGLDNLEAVPGAAAALRRLKSAGVRLEAVTSRPPIMRQSTEALLNRLFAPGTFSGAHFVGPGEKGHTCNAIGARVLVDDQLPNCVDCCACGVVGVLFDFCGSYPWSQHATELPARCKRIETWAETCNFLLLALGVDPLEHYSQGSDYLMAVKAQSMEGQENLTAEYLDALSEAGKQATEYDDDFDQAQRASDFAPQTLPPRTHEEQAPRSEPWWKNRDEPKPQIIQREPAFQSSYRFGSNVDEPQKQRGQSPTKFVDASATRREPLHAWNSAPDGDYQRGEFRGASNHQQVHQSGGYSVGLRGPPQQRVAEVDMRQQSPLQQEQPSSPMKSSNRDARQQQALQQEPPSSPPKASRSSSNNTTPSKAARPENRAPRPEEEDSSLGCVIA